jgi:hypothetical protein
MRASSCSAGGGVVGKGNNARGGDNERAINKVGTTRQGR